MAKTVVALYDEFEQAQKAVKELTDKGVKRDNISLISNNASGEYDRYVGNIDSDRDQQEVHRESHSQPGKGTGIGAGTGAGLGALTGLLLGLGVFTIPGVGPALAAGPIVSTLVGAGVGAVAGGLVGALVGLGLPKEEAEIYTEGVRRGGTLLVVQTTDDKADQANNILDNHNPVDIETRAAEWRERGWTGYDKNAEPYTAEQVEQERTHRRTHAPQPTHKREKKGQETIPVTGEEVKVGKREIETGGVRARSYVTEEPVEENVNLRHENVNVERRPVDRKVHPDDQNAFQEKTIEAVEHAEEPVVSKEARVFEEVVISRDVDEHTEMVRDTARKTDVDVKEVGSGHTGDGKFETFRNDFRSHYSNHMGNTSYSYDEYEPVYRYGYNLGHHNNYRDRDWSSVEPEARNAWEERNPGTWDQSRDAVRYGWEKAQGKR